MLAIFCLAVGATAANAQEDALFPGPFPDTVVAKADQQRPPVLRFRLGPVQGLLEKTTLGQLQRRLGGRIVRNNGDGAEGEYHLCYFLAAGGTPQVLRFLSNAEMGGTTHVITGIETQTVTGKPAGCSNPAKQVRAFSMDHGLRIGPAMAGTAKAFGKPSAATGTPIRGAGALFYVYGKPLTNADPVFGGTVDRDRANGRLCDLSDLLRIQARRGRVYGFVASRVTSC